MKENLFSEQVDRYRLKTNSDVFNQPNEFYLDIFSLNFDSLFFLYNIFTC